MAEMIVKVYRTHFFAAFVCLLAGTACDKNKPIISTQIESFEIQPDDKRSSIIENDSLIDTKEIILASIDSVSLKEIKRYAHPQKSIFEYYAMEEIDEVEIWSDKMFGRCCTEADLLYSELLEFKISANINDPKYPYNNLSDTNYRSAFVFAESQNTEIYIQLNPDSDWHVSQTNLVVEEVLKPQDTLLNPFYLSIVNGYVKSEATFKENARVKQMEVFLNDVYQGTVQLLDTPLPQEFEVDFTFTKNDTVMLVPTAYYKGAKYNDVCISEIQSSLAQITHPSINEKYKVRELWKIGYETRQQ